HIRFVRPNINLNITAVITAEKLPMKKRIKLMPTCSNMVLVTIRVLILLLTVIGEGRSVYSLQPIKIIICQMLIIRITLATIYKILPHIFINITPPLLQARNYLQKLQKWVDFPRDPAPINFRLKLHNQPAPVANHRKLSILTTGPEPFHRYPSIFYVFPVSLEPFFPLFHLLLYNRKPIARPYYDPA